MDNNDKNIAVLIDADNVSSKYIKYIFDEISNYGTPTYKRIYGDWTRPQLAAWKNVLLSFSIMPIQQYNYTTGKNSTDAALIIDAMDILYSKSVDGFCIVSSDGDFTRLAARFREEGMLVIGMGERKTPTPFIAACEKFKYLEVLASSNAGSGKSHAEETDKNGQKAGMTSKREISKALKTIITEISDEDGWAGLGAVGSTLSRRFPDFDARNYGFSKLTPFIASLKIFELQSRKIGDNNTHHNYVRNKE